MIARFAQRLPFFYGWVVVAVAFVTMALGVNARTAFSLLLPPILDEFGWDRGVTAGAFSFGFLVSAILSPTIGRMMDRSGPRVVLMLGAVASAAGLLLAGLTHAPWHLYLTLGVLVGSGSICLGYSGQALYLPYWFVRRRGFAISVAYAGVGVGSVVMMPWLQHLIETSGWRSGCFTLGLVVLVVAAPLTLLLARRPQELGLLPDGDRPVGSTPLAQATGASGASGTAGAAGAAGASQGSLEVEASASTSGQPQPAHRSNVVDPAWTAIDWTLSRAMRTGRFWWIALGYFGGLYAWYSVQVHQTRYLTEIGFPATDAAWALGVVSLAGIPGQIALGYWSDRVGREPVWAIGCLGFVITYLALLALKATPSLSLLYVMVIAQGLLGYGMTSVLGAIPSEIFEGRHYGSIFGTLMLGGIGGGAAGPWITGLLHDHFGDYVAAFWLSALISVVSAIAIWRASPGKVRAVAGRIDATS